MLNVLPALEAGGAELSTLEIAAALRDAGARVLVVSSGGRLAAGLGAAHVCLPADTRNPIGLWRNSARLRALIAREVVDLVHAHSPAPAWSAWVAARRAGVPFVTTFHSIYGVSNAAKRAYNRIMIRGDLVIAVSNFAAEHMKAIYDCPSSRIRVVHHGIDAAMFDPSAVPARKKASLRGAWRVREGARVVLLPGRFTRRKGHGVLIEAVRQLTLSDANLVAPGAAAQHLGQRIGKRRWLGKLQNGIVTHGVSLLRWRSGGSITPTIRRLNPSPRHQLLAIAQASDLGRTVEVAEGISHPAKRWMPHLHINPFLSDKALRPPGGTTVDQNVVDVRPMSTN